MAWNLLQGTLKGLMNATDRLYKSFASATGGNFATAGETRESAGKAAVGAATGAAVMAGGGSFLQAMGGAFGDARTAQTMNYASRMLGGEDTLLGRAAEAVGEGASARTMGGPVGGALLGAQNRRNRQDEADREARLAYTGGADADREAALADYRETLDRDALTGAFDEEDAQRVQALTLTYDDDQVDAVADTVRRVRNANPDLPPDSPAFQRAVRDDLPPDLVDIETAALNDMATVFGAPAEPQPGRYDKAAALFQPIPTPGAADTARDAALAAYRGSGDEAALGDAFSPEDANRVARLMDAYDDDDFAEVIAAVRAARDANPDLDPDSPRALAAARAELSPRLAPMPSSDLRAFSRAFGASGTPPALVEPETDLPYIGRRDQRRDAALADYRADGHEDGLLNVYSPLQAQQVMELDGEYAAEDFEAVVRAVRQARTEDPDLEAGSTRAVRAARRQLPDRLRQMPSQDLAAFSGIYGAEADAPAASDTLKRGSRRPAPEVEPVRLSDVLSPDESRTLALAFGPDVDAEDLMIYPNQAARDSPPSPAAPTRPAPLAPQTHTGVATQPIPTPTEAATPLTRISGIGPATQVQLRAAGIETVEDLAQADPAQLAELPRVTRSRAQAWVVAAGMMTAPSVPPNAPLPSTPGPFTATGRAALRQQQVAAATPPPPDDGPPPPRDYSQVTPPPVQQAAPPPPAAPVRPQSPDAEPPPPRDDSQATPPPVQSPTSPSPPAAPQHRVETSATRQQPAPSSPRPTERTPSAQGTPTPTPSAPQRRVDTPTAPPAQGAPPPTPIAPQRRTDTPAAPPTQGAPTPPAPAPQRRADTPTAPPAQGAPQPTPPAPQRPVAPSPPSTAQGAPAPTPPAPQRRTDTSVAPPPAPGTPPPPLTSSDSPSTDSSAPSDPLASQEDHVT